MKQAVTIGAHIASLLVFLATIDAGNLLFRFFTVGELPGGTVFVSADTMFVATAVSLGIVTLSILFRIVSNLRLPAVTAQLPKRRFSSIQ